MDILIVAILMAIVAYLIGSFSGAIILSKRIYDEDIRNSGSKNAGTTNMLRVYGKKAAAITLIIDILKGVLAVAIGVVIDKFFKGSQQTGWEAQYLLGSMKYIAAVFAILGHDFPIYFGFRGGKGVATSLGVILVLDWKIGLIVLVMALIIMLASRYVSLGSISAAVIYVCVVLAFMLGKNDFNLSYLICSVILALLIIIKHHKNISRLKNGTENKLSFKSKKKEADGE